MERVKQITKKTLRWIIFLILILIFIKISEDVFGKEIFQFDEAIYNFLVNHRNAGLNIFFKAITQFGGAIGLAIITILCVILIKDKKYRILVPANLVIIGTINILLKNIFERQRPNKLRLIEENGYSFPSGHAMASTAFYGILIYIAYKKIKNKKLRNITCVMLSILILLIDISRIYVGVHYVSDVLGGTCFSIAYLIIVTKILDYNEKNKLNEEQ